MVRGSILGALLLVRVAWPAAGVAGQYAGDTLMLDLQEAERRALAHGALLEAAEADVELARTQRDRARHARVLPEFNLRNVWGPVPRQRGEFLESGVLTSPDTSTGITDFRWFTQVDLSAVQPLVTFGKIGARVEAAEHGIEASEAALEQARSQLLLTVRQLYWGAVLGRELERVVGDVLDLVEETEARLDELFEAGDATQNDMFKFRLFQYEIGRRSREVEAQVEQARAGLRTVTGLPPGVPFRPADAALAPLDLALDSLSTYLETAISQRPQLNQLRAGVSARNALARGRERDAWPSMFVAAELKINEAPSRFNPENPFWQDQTNFTRPGIVVGFDWNLSSFLNRDQARLERYEAVKLEAQLAPLRARVEQEVRESYLEARRAQADVEDGEAAVRASENWLRAEVQTYDIGLGDIEDVISAFQANVEMRAEHLSNIAEFNIAVAELNHRVGAAVRP